jgi:hypothetical protein
MRTPPSDGPVRAFQPSEELIARIKSGDKGVNLNEIIDAVESGQVTEEEVTRLYPEIAKAAQAMDLSGVSAMIEESQRSIADAAKMLKRPHQTVESPIPPVEPLAAHQLDALRDLRTELQAMTLIAKASGQQIRAMVATAAITNEKLDGLRKEIKTQRWLTVALVLLTATLVGCTIALIRVAVH